MNITNEFITIDDCKIGINYIIQDINKPTIVFLHDALGSIAQWKKFPKKLLKKTGLNALLYDRSGHGNSNCEVDNLTADFFEKEAFDILPKLLSQLNIDNFILYGHSDGGTIALLYASDSHLPQAKAIIVEAAHILNEDITIRGIKETALKSQGIIKKLQKYHGTKAKSLFSNWVELWTGENMVNWNIESKVNIDIPTLLIQGIDDEYGSEKQVKKIEKCLNVDYEIYMLHNCGHFPHKEKPALIVEKVKSFLTPIINI